MTLSRRDVVRLALGHREVPYVPWSFSFTHEAAEKLRAHYQTRDLEATLQNHIHWLGSPGGRYTPVGNGCVRDVFGVTWDQSIDKDIGIVVNPQLAEPKLADYQFPDPATCPAFFEDIERRLAERGDRFVLFGIGFSLFERAWSLRGMENLLEDLVVAPEFVNTLLGRIADFNLAVIHHALKYKDIDAVYFGDDWGQQHGLIMGQPIWHALIRPHLLRQYAAVREAGKYVFIHSCGDVDELFDDLIQMGVQCFNPFQPEVMDVLTLMQRYRGRLAFHGGLSTQRTLPYGTVDQVTEESQRLLAAGARGGYIFAPAHAVEGDVPLENMLAFIAAATGQMVRG